MRAWRGSVAGGAGLRVAVNISGRHLQHGDLVQDVAQALEESGLEPGNLVIELTESTIMHNTEANLGRLRQLKALGVRLAIDDFGTGYSSLSYLHRFPIDILKIDHSFVNRLTNTYNGPELARAVITLGETLGLDTVAEGIELEPQVAALLAAGLRRRAGVPVCDVGIAGATFEEHVRGAAQRAVDGPGGGRGSVADGALHCAQWHRWSCLVRRACLRVTAGSSCKMDAALASQQYIPSDRRAARA